MQIRRLILAVLFLAGLHAQSRPDQANEKGVVRTQMRNVMYRFSSGIGVHIRRLGGELRPIHGAPLVIFDDKESFVLKITAAEIAFSQQALQNTLNSHVFSAKDAPLKDISVIVEHQRVKIKGKLHAKGDVAFEGEGKLSATDDGKIRLHVEKVRALHLPVKGLMDLLGVNLADLIKSGKVRGVEAEKDDLILDPSQILPPPRIEGQVSSVRLENGNIVQVFGEPDKYKWAQVPAQNYMAYRGGRLRFGKLTMDDTDMILIDMSPDDPFDFYLDRYIEQLVAGFTRNTRENGLRVFMKDYDKLHTSKTRGR